MGDAVAAAAAVMMGRNSLVGICIDGDDVFGMKSAVLVV